MNVVRMKEEVDFHVDLDIIYNKNSMKKHYLLVLEGLNLEKTIETKLGKNYDFFTLWIRCDLIMVTPPTCNDGKTAKLILSSKSYMISLPFLSVPFLPRRKKIKPALEQTQLFFTVWKSIDSQHIVWTHSHKWKTGTCKLNIDETTS